MITGHLALDGFGGSSEQTVEVVGQTPRRLRIRAITSTRLAGRNRILQPGETTLVPTYAVRDNCVQCGGRKGGVPGNENIVNGRRVCDYCHAAAPDRREGQ
jgi:hypothetical protein